MLRLTSTSPQNQGSKKISWSHFFFLSGTCNSWPQTEAATSSQHLITRKSHFPPRLLPLPEILSLNNQHTTDALRGITKAFLLLGKWQSQPRLCRTEGLLPDCTTSKACCLITQDGKLDSSRPERLLEAGELPSTALGEKGWEFVQQEVKADQLDLGEPGGGGGAGDRNKCK